ncbi:amino acid adenylation domain-containing protein [Streptomyces sp. NPDC050732]|uniref:non-ribosomal peptide synthetase n=1 Tax=Streptomyces sp. NPDC050732 TaxID=3154632 RepID=UPI003427AFF9
MARAARGLDRRTRERLAPLTADATGETLALTAAAAAAAFHYAGFVTELTLCVAVPGAAGTQDDKILVVETGVDPELSLAAHAERIAKDMRARSAEEATAAAGHWLVLGPGTADEGARHPHETAADGPLLALDPVDGRLAARSDSAPRPECDVLAGLFATLLGHALDEPGRPLVDCPVLTGPERSRVLTDFNATARDFPDDRTLHEVFRGQAARTPDRVAVTTDDAELTYAELDERSDRLAHALRGRLGDGTDVVVAVLAERGLELPVALLGVLKAGYAYTPLDPYAPALRIQDILERSGARAVVGQEHLLAGRELPVDTLVLEAPELTAGPVPEAVRHGSPDDLAYVIYTSGSTGRPKGVMVEHRSVVNRLCWMQRDHPLGQDDTLIQKTPVIFDVSVWELFWWMFGGSRMYLPAPGAERFPLALAEGVRKHGVTAIHFVPSMLNVFLDEVERSGLAGSLSGLRVLYSSGEILPRQVVDSFHTVLGAPNGTRLVNLYGPTETTVDVTAYTCAPGDPAPRVPIGGPIDNTRLYVLRHGHPMPVGVFGTLHVAGVGVARGYLGDEELTREKFVPEYQVPGRERPDGRMYDTGDVARWLPSGDIEFLGRQDQQVKIRGIRIDLQEIENVLLEAPGVVECAVRLEQTNAFIAVLRAAVTGTDELDRNRLRGYVADRLPAYMVPATYDRFDRLPRTPSGKIDRRSLTEDPDLTARGKRL